MKAIKLSEERYFQIMPKNVIDSTELSENAKKVLATIINYHLTQEKVKEMGFLIISNNTLRKSVGLKYNDVLNCLTELQELDLIIRKTGKRRKTGEKAVASEYYVQWENLNKPIVKKTGIELLKKFFKTPVGTAITTTNSESISTNDSDSVYTSISTNDSDSVYTSISTNDSVYISDYINDSVDESIHDTIDDSSTICETEIVDDSIDNTSIEKTHTLYKNHLDNMLRATALKIAEENNINLS